jgi:DNA mismatch endonuclease (patch repair protein)
MVPGAVEGMCRFDWRTRLPSRRQPPAEALMDSVTPQVRSQMMSAIRGRDTNPELAVRSYLHACGLRFRINVRHLPGTPDLVLRQWGTVLFVHGCFWHRHAGCSFATTPATRSEFWESKFSANIARDRRNEPKLREMGWNVLTIWECETRSLTALDELFWRIVATSQGAGATAKPSASKRALSLTRSLA